MKYRVRSRDGEIEFQSFGQMEQAWLMGLVDPDDEVLEDGTTLWRKARTIPLLARAERTHEQAWGGTWFLWVLAGVVGGTVALVLAASEDWTSKAVGLLLAFVVAGVMFRVTMRAHERRKPHR